MMQYLSYDDLKRKRDKEREKIIKIINKFKKGKYVLKSEIIDEITDAMKRSYLPIYCKKCKTIFHVELKNPYTIYYDENPEEFLKQEKILNEELKTVPRLCDKCKKIKSIK